MCILVVRCFCFLHLIFKFLFLQKIEDPGSEFPPTEKKIEERGSESLLQKRLTPIVTKSLHTFIDQQS